MDTTNTMQPSEENQINVIDKGDFPWVLFTVGDIVYGIHSSYILSIEILGEVTPLVNSAPHTRGIADFRGTVITLTDLRILFGLNNRLGEYEQIIEPKIEAHRTWVGTLRQCVRDHSHFSLATDPHNCAFGKWYYSFKTNNNALASYLSRIEGPHAKLHLSGEKVMQLVMSGHDAEAEKMMLEVIEPTYNETMALLEGTMAAFREGIKEMLIVLEVNGESKGVIVDDIVSVEYINRTVEMQGFSGQTNYIKRIGKREKDDSPIMLFDGDLMEIL